MTGIFLETIQRDFPIIGKRCCYGSYNPLETITHDFFVETRKGSSCPELRFKRKTTESNGPSAACYPNGQLAKIRSPCSLSQFDQQAFHRSNGQGCCEHLIYRICRGLTSREGSGGCWSKGRGLKFEMRGALCEVRPEGGRELDRGTQPPALRQHQKDHGSF